jgi:hypothetical protein
LLVQPVDAKVPLAPVAGAPKVTEAPETGLPKLSVSKATSGAENAVEREADWEEPDTTEMFTALPALMVSAWVPEVRPVADAVIVGVPATVSA